MDEPVNSDELRTIVRRTLLEMLQRAPMSQPSGGQPDLSTELLSSRNREQELRVTLRGNQRSIGLLEQALRDGGTMFEVTVESQWGPQARVMAELT